MSVFIKNYFSKLSFPLFLIISGVLLFLSSQYSFLLFHTLVEFSAVVIAFGIFVVSWSSRHYIDKNFLLIVGVGYFFVGAFDLIHTLSYEGLGIFQDYTANLPTQFWIIGRFLEALTFLVAVLFLKKARTDQTGDATKKAVLIFFCYLALFAFTLLSVFYWKIFPMAYSEGVGATQFKNISEYAIAFIFFVSVVILFKKYEVLDQEIVNFLSLAIMIKIFSELFFVGHVGVDDFSNIVGLLLRFISSLLIYKAVLGIGLMNPYRLLFKDLQESQRKSLAFQKELRKRTEDDLVDAYRHLGVANRKMALLSEMDGQFKADSKKRNKEKIIQHILEVAKSASNAKVTLLYGYNKDRTFSLISPKNDGNDKIYGIKKISVSQAGFLEYLIENRRRVNAKCGEVDVGCFKCFGNLKYFVVLPLVYRQRSYCAGFLFLGFENRDSLDKQELEFLDVFSIHATAMLSRLKMRCFLPK